MNQWRFHRYSLSNRLCRETAVVLLVAAFATIALRGTLAAATCTSTVFSGTSFNVDDAITGRGSGTASVSGCDGDITSVSVTLTFNPLPFERDLDLLLVHPNGVNNLVFLSDVGNNASFTGTIAVADTGVTCLPQETGSGVGALTSGTTYRPAEYSVFPDDFGAPVAPLLAAGQGCPGAAGTHSFASAFSGLSANGTWTLFAYDDIGPNSANYAVNWSLTITTSTTAAQVETFTATPVNEGGVQIKWRTGYEVDNLGFDIYREQDGQRTKLNPSLIAGSALLAGPGTALTAGRSYVWWDRSMQGTEGARYWLEDVDLSGQRTWHGPAVFGEVASSGPVAPQGPIQAVLLSGVGRGGTSQARTLPVQRRATLVTSAAGLSARQTLLAARPALKLLVPQEGWYQVTQPELLAAGLNPSADPRLLQLYVDGRQIPIRVAGQDDGRFDATDAVEFYGLGWDAAWSDTRVYWLVVGVQAGERIPLVSARGAQPAGHSFPYTVERRERTVYFSSLLNGDRENFFGAVISRQPVEQSLLVQHPDPTPSGSTLLEVELQGVTAGVHRVQVTLNGVGVGEITFQGQEEGLASFPVAPSWLHEGENQVELTAQGGEQDVSLVDGIRLTYWHSYTADDDALRFSAAGGQQVTITGFSSAAIRVVDITDVDRVREVTGVVQPQDTGFAVTLGVPGSGPKTLLAFTPMLARPVTAVVPNQPSRWRRPGHGADLVVIGHRDFIDNIEPLRARRQSQGLQVVVVDVEDVFDEFSHGQKTPYALRDFLRYATMQWTPTPRFVLFVGDASLDPKNYLGFGDFDFVPTKLIDTALMETASDEWLADLDSDGRAELAIGRLPVRTPEEAERLVAKLVSYDQTVASAGVLLVADQNDGFAFDAANIQLRDFLPAEVPVNEISRSQLGTAAAKQQLSESLNQGPALVNYLGHGSVDLWRGNLLNAEDARALRNGARLPVVVTMTCLNGYFHDPALDSLAEAFLLAEDGGAVAVWASSGMTGAGGQALMNQELYRWLFTDNGSNGASLTLGEATVQAKAAARNVELRRTWTLFGDPTMVLNVR
jgi:Peptidase family C25